MMRLLLMVTVSPCLWLSSLMMYFSREPPGPGEERLARILPALTHLTRDNKTIMVKIILTMTVMVTSHLTAGLGLPSTLHSMLMLMPGLALTTCWLTW